MTREEFEKAEDKYWDLIKREYQDDPHIDLEFIDDKAHVSVALYYGSSRNKSTQCARVVCETIGELGAALKMAKRLTSSFERFQRYEELLKHRRDEQANKNHHDERAT
jgi:hypothetical protein